LISFFVKMGMDIIHKRLKVLHSMVFD